MSLHHYLMGYRYEALVVSELSPQEFGQYMAVGTRKRTTGRLMFFEVDAEQLDWQYFLRQPFEPNPDGSPKRSQYVSIYRVMEHVPLSAFGRLHLVTQDGMTLPLDGQPAPADSNEQAYMFVELCPVGPRVVSTLGPAAFTRFITDPTQPIHFPRLFFADQKIERRDDGRLAESLPYPDHAHIVDCLEELKNLGKVTKTVDRLPPLIAFYRTIKSGFYLGDQQGCRFYPFPDQARLEDELHLWWRSAQMA